MFCCVVLDTLHFAWISVVVVVVKVVLHLMNLMTAAQFPCHVDGY